jgi:hypothetical protein
MPPVTSLMGHGSALIEQLVTLESRPRQLMLFDSVRLFESLSHEILELFDAVAFVAGDIVPNATSLPFSRDGPAARSPEATLRMGRSAKFMMPS